MSKTKRISYEATGSFSKLVIDYLNQDKKLREFVTEFPSVESIKKQIDTKKNQLVDRNALVEVLREQYKINEIEIENSKIGESLSKLKDEKTFTICTAHQPNIFTGYLYTIYKIIQTINLAEECKKNFPEYNFVPVYFIGSEDNDIEEIGAFNFKGKKHQWEPNDTGACGRFSTESLIDIRDEILAKFGSSKAEVKLKEQIKAAYNGKKTLTQATQYFINSLFSKQGLIALDADDKRLKESFKKIVKDELANQTSHKVVIEHNNRLAKNYKVQVDPRELNLFYLRANTRERIEKSGDKWTVINSEIELDNIELVDSNPEYFSPNVILRPLYQETILPNVAFIGGGSEIAYWCELKPLFDKYNLPFPILFVRNSVSIVSEKIFNKMGKIGFEESFKPLENALKEKSLQHPAYIQLLQDFEKIISDYKSAFKSAEEINPSLEISTAAHLTKILKTQERIKTKYRAQIKREFEDLTNNKLKILEELFPNSKMQERNENYLELVNRYKIDIIPALINAQQGFGFDYLVLSL